MLAQVMDLVLRAGAAAAVIGGLLVLFAKAPRASVTLVLILSVLEGSREWPVPLGLTAGFLNLGWADLATTLMGFVALSRLAWRVIIHPAGVGLVGLFGLVTVGLIAWGVAVGLLPSSRYWWVWTFALTTAFYAASFPELRRPGGLRPFVWAAVLGSGMQVIGFSRRGFGSSLDAVDVNGQLSSARPVTAAVALIMLIGLVVVLLDGRRWTMLKCGLASWLAVSVVLAQHRSVWVAAAVAGILLVRAFAGRSRTPLAAGVVAAMGVGMAGGAVAIAVRSQQQLAVSASYTGSLDWRIQNWIEKLSIERSYAQWLFGSAFGPTPLNDGSTNILFEYSSHNMYVETIAVLGLVGLGLLVLVIVGAIRGSKSAAPERVVFGSLLAYGLFYQWPGAAWLMVGVCVATERSASPQPPTAVLPDRSAHDQKRRVA